MSVVPEKIGKYEIVDLIGTGGFGQVFRARDPGLNRDVAIKLCSLEDRELLVRFAREAKISGALQHPNIVVVHDFGFDGERPYLVQELLAGRDLDEIIRAEEWVPYAIRFEYLRQVAEALSYAHSQGIVHRDVKPDNVRVLPNGQVKVLDFGIARFAHAGSRLTTAGMSLGTIGYLSPEQIRGEEVDVRADLFSYGVLCYEVLSYRRPFEAESAFTVLHHILQRDPVPLRDAWPECPAELDRLVMRCLERDRRKRFVSFEELLPRLRSACAAAIATGELPDEGPPTSPQPQLSRAKTPRELDLSETMPIDSDRVAAETRRHPLVRFMRRLRSAWRHGHRARAMPARKIGTERQPSHSYDTAIHRLAGSRGAVVLVAAIGVAFFAIWLAFGGLVTEEGGERAAADLPRPAPAQLGLLRVEAQPWGRVERIHGGGETWAIGVSTPVVVEVPVGLYDIVLSHPDVMGPTLCEVEVRQGETAGCSETLMTEEVDTYFEEMGWYP